MRVHPSIRSSAEHRTMLHPSSPCFLSSAPSEAHQTLKPKLATTTPMAARRGAHVIHLHDPSPAILGRAPPPPHASIPEEPPRLLQHPRQPHPLHSSAAAAAISALEDRLAARDRDIQELLIDNQRFAATHVALTQQLIDAQHELHAVSVAANQARGEREAEVRGLAERAARTEAEARAAAAARAELEQVRADVRVLAAARGELADRLQGLCAELARAQAEASQSDAVRAQIDAMHREIQKGRAAIDFEKKAHADNLEQSKLMEKNMISVAGEIEKLRAELANAEKRAAAAAAAAAAANPGYGTTYGNSEVTYGGNFYSDAYSTNQAQMHADGNPQYMAATVPYAQYDAQHASMHR